MESQISRKKFIKLLGVSSAALVVCSALGFGSKPASKKTAGHVRIRPLAGEHYSPSFLKFCERSRFQSTAEAMRKVRNRSKAFAVVMEHHSV
jgi:hypothetical protein